MEKKIRLDKYLADMGIGTRSEVKNYIRKGKITVDGVIEKSPELKIDSSTQQITFEGRVISYVHTEYYMFHKPAGCVSATEDKVHKTVLDYIDAKRKDLFPVGRLDIDTEGLLLITNDGELAHQLLSPKKHVDKVYYAKINDTVTQADADAFAAGIDIGEDACTMPADLTILSTSEDGSEVEITIREGKFHQIKRMFTAVGKEVLYLKRLSMGALHLDSSLAPGEYRPLTKEEILALKS